MQLRLDVVHRLARLFGLFVALLSHNTMIVQFRLKSMAVALCVHSTPKMEAHSLRELYCLPIILVTVGTG